LRRTEARDRTSAAPGRLIRRAPGVLAALALAGCWTAPVATVQPQGEPRLIQDGIKVESSPAAVVSSVDRSAGTIDLRMRGRIASWTYRIGPQVSGAASARRSRTVPARHAIAV